ncbi:MAG: homogentisate 1,2-dioxygenase domain-containing protein, partial [Streptosporangiaceae bacterium]
LVLGNGDVRISYVVAETPSPFYRNGIGDECVFVESGAARVETVFGSFDVVGWDGCLYPYTFNVDDFEPITGRVHQPPPVHQVFEGNNFVVCNFVPRKVDYHPLSIPVPYYHSNVDSDEVMFYCGGDYEARRGSGIAQGSISLHPGGHTHGPQPGAMERSLGAEFFDELAIMIDTFAPLELGEGALASEDPDYAWTWNVRR